MFDPEKKIDLGPKTEETRFKNLKVCETDFLTISGQSDKKVVHAVERRAQIEAPKWSDARQQDGGIDVCQRGNVGAGGIGDVSGHVAIPPL